MRKLLLFFPLFLVAFTISDDGISKKERKFAISYLEDTRDDLANTISGLSEDQLNFKPAENRWSVKECLQHIALTENSLWKWAEATIKAPPTPEKRAEVKTTDEQLVKMITDRSQKFQAAPDLTPDKSVFTTAMDAFEGFKTARRALIKYVKNTKVDLRNHIAQGPMGSVDAYQLILFIGAHSNRHTQQIAEVMADPNFPKK